MNPRITIEANKMGGVPCIRGFRIPVVTVARLVRDGLEVAKILEDFPDLEAEDVAAAVEYATDHQLDLTDHGLTFVDP